VEFVPVCPEVELGLGTPRETLRLVRRAADVRLVMADGADHTDAMRAFGARRVEALAREDLDGFILKKDSPSCGLERVKVYDRHGSPIRSGRGLFAEALVTRWPHLPVEDEGRLHDARLRENFVERLFAYRRLKDLFAGRWSMGAVVRFHTVYKLILLSHSPEGYRKLGRLVADGKALARPAFRAAYETQFMRTLQNLATPKKHANVLLHMIGHFRDRLDAASRRELIAAIDDYRRGWLPLVVPITLTAHHVRRLDVGYLADQIYLAPHPKELMLRNHV
jgi:uncharacterized protein YbgA (DUF1722 family)/uncharacterized protein YbbK (DUF523 family)